MLLVFLIHLLFLTPVLGQLPSGLCLPTVLPGTSENTVSSSFSQAYAVKTDPITGKLFVADASVSISRIYRFAAGAGLLSSQTPEATFGGTGTTSASTLLQPYDITFSSTAQMYVADYGNGRILGYTTQQMGSASSGVAADKVIQQSDFVTTISTLGYTSVGMDNNGNLWYSDTSGGLRMTSAATLASGSVLPICDLVLVAGISTGCSQTTLSSSAYTIQFDASNNLFIADSVNNRIMVWNSAFSKSNFAAADIVLGQASFTSCGAQTTQSGLKSPQACSYDVPSSTLLVADNGNGRIMLFQSPTTSGQNAVYQFGQTSFTSTADNTASALDLKYDRIGGTNSLYTVDGTNLKRFCPVSFSFSVTNTVTVTVSNTNTNSNSFTSSYTNSVTNSYTSSYTNSYSTSYTSSYSPSYSTSVSKKAAGRTLKRSAASTPVCGNGVVEGKELCDEGKDNGGGFSCCSVFCQLYIHGTKCGRIPGPGCIRAPHCNLVGNCVSGVQKRDGTKCYKKKGRCFKGVCNN